MRIGMGIDMFASRRRVSAPSFALSDVASKTLLLVDTASTKSITSGTPNVIDSWNDQSGGARNLTASTTARPEAAAAVLHGRDVVRFDGSNDLLAGAALSNFITASAWTIYCVARWRSVASLVGAASPWTHDAVLGDASGYLALTAKQAATYGSDQAITVQGYNFDGSADVVSASATQNVWYLLRLRLSGGNLGLRVGRAGSEVTTASGNTQVLTGALRLGRGNAASVFGAVDIAWCLIKNAAPDSTEDSNIISLVGTQTPTVV